METRRFNKSWFSRIVYYAHFGWTIFCIIGTWLIILKYGILLQGIFAVVMAFLFAVAGWALPLMGLLLLSLYLEPKEEPLGSVPFKELIQKGMRNSLE